MRLYKRILVILIVSLLIPAFYPAPAQAAGQKTKTNTWPKCPSIDAEAACVMELSSGLVLYNKNMKKKNYPASITKIMTTLLAIENCSLGEEVTFSAEAVASIPWDGTKLGVTAGEKISIEQCLYAIMLHSANDVCAGVAEYMSGSEEKFSKQMTERAQEIGCVNTHFTNPHGLHDENHYTCAYDMCLIGREAMKNSIFRQVVKNRSYTVGKTNKSDERVINNHHQMINGYRTNYIYEYDRVIGGKTGYTSMAENTLVTFAKKGDMEIVCVVMRAQSNNYRENQYTDTRKLIDSAFENFQLYTMDGSSSTKTTSDVSEYSPMFTKYNALMSEKHPVITLEGVPYIVLPKGVKKQKASQSIQYYDQSASIGRDQTAIGEVSYTYNGKTVGNARILYHPQTSQRLTGAEQTTSILSMKDKFMAGFGGKVLAHKQLLIIIGMVAGALAAIGLIYVIIRNLHTHIRQNGRSRRKRRRF